MMRKHYLSLVDTHFSQSKNVHNDLVKNGHVEYLIPLIDLQKSIYKLRSWQRNLLQ